MVGFRLSRLSQIVKVGLRLLWLGSDCQGWVEIVQVGFRLSRLGSDCQGLVQIGSYCFGLTYDYIDSRFFLTMNLDRL